MQWITKLGVGLIVLELLVFKDIALKFNQEGKVDIAKVEISEKETEIEEQTTKKEEEIETIINEQVGNLEKSKNQAVKRETKKESLTENSEEVGILVDANTKLYKDIFTKISFKYGVKLREESTIYYRYVNEEKAEVKRVTKLDLDKTGFKASDEEMEEEALKKLSEYQDIILEVLEYTNNYRKEVGLEALALDKELARAASLRSLEMAYSGIVKHTRPNGKSWSSLSSKAQGENIAYGARSAVEVCQDWRNSKGHYQNIVNKSFKIIGIGLYVLDGEYYWTQQFGY